MNRSKKLFGLFLLYIFIVYSSCAGESDQDTNSTGGASRMGENNPILTEKVINFLGNDIIDGLKQAESAHTYHIKGRQLEEGNNTLAGYPVIAAGRKLTKEETAAFSQIAFDERTYLFDMVKKCPFVPDYALVIPFQDDNLTVLLSFNCDQWRFLYKDTNLLEDFDAKKKELKNLIDKAFNP